MSIHGLIKANSLCQRLDTILDWTRLNDFRIKHQMKPLNPLKKSVRSLENCVCLGLPIWSPLPFELVRGEQFYRSIREEISDMEKKMFFEKNKL